MAIAFKSQRIGSTSNAKGIAIKPTVSTPTAMLGAGLFRAARPPVKSATPSVAAEASAAAGDRSAFRPPIVAFAFDPLESRV
jgi:hypothetical protein